MSVLVSVHQPAPAPRAVLGDPMRRIVGDMTDEPGQLNPPARSGPPTPSAKRPWSDCGWPPPKADLPAGSSSPVVPTPAGQAEREWVVAVMGDVKVFGDSYAEPVRRTLRAWLTRDDRDRRAIE